MRLSTFFKSAQKKQTAKTMKTKINYKGRGEHSVQQLEQIIEQLQEELHLYKSGQKQFDKKSTDRVRDWYKSRGMN